MSNMTNASKKKERNKERILNYLDKYINDHGYSPSVREIAQAVGFKSTSTVHSYLLDLQEEGYITYADGKRRAISINESEDDSSEDTDDTEVIDFEEELARRMPETSTWPLVGLVTAGQPILATENKLFDISLDQKLFPRGKDDSFLLKVRGDSMIDAGIHDGDLILVSPTQQAELNEIVVALIGDEATVKRFGYISGDPYLFPENEAFDPIPFNTEDCKILGQVIGLIRTRL